MQLKSLQELKSEETKANLLEAAARILEEYGVKYCTVRNVCEEAGVSSGSFYYHFGNKESLLYEYLNNLYSQVVSMNPMPEYAKEKAYLGDIMWPFLVYAKFCERLGVGIARMFLEDPEKDPFMQVTFKIVVEERVRRLFSSRPLRYNSDAVNEDMIQDLRMICKGMLANWCYTDGREYKRSICEDMEHLIFRFFMSFEYDEFVEKIGAGILICEQPGFDDYFDMSCVKVVVSEA